MTGRRTVTLDDVRYLIRPSICMYVHSPPRPTRLCTTREWSVTFRPQQRRKMVFKNSSNSRPRQHLISMFPVQRLGIRDLRARRRRCRVDSSSLRKLRSKTSQSCCGKPQKRQQRSLWPTKWLSTCNLCKIGIGCLPFSRDSELESGSSCNLGASVFLRLNPCPGTRLSGAQRLSAVVYKTWKRRIQTRVPRGSLAKMTKSQ
jgi:hypothetical protein